MNYFSKILWQTAALACMVMSLTFLTSCEELSITPDSTTVAGPSSVITPATGITVPAFFGQPVASTSMLVTSLQPAETKVGRNIAIIGQNLVQPYETQVFFNGDLPADVISVSDTLMIVTVPEGAVSGPIHLEAVEFGTKTPHLTIVD